MSTVLAVSLVATLISSGLALRPDPEAGSSIEVTWSHRGEGRAITSGNQTGAKASALMEASEELAVQAEDSECTKLGGVCSTEACEDSNGEGFTESGLCNGGSDRVCCFKGNDKPCEDNGGTCTTSCSGRHESGMCAGGSSRKCCIGGSKESDDETSAGPGEGDSEGEVDNPPSDANNLLSEANQNVLNAQVAHIDDICELSGELEGKVSGWAADDAWVLQKMQEKGYDVETEPGVVNVVGAREVNLASNVPVSDKFTNKFRDHLYIFWKCSGDDEWRVYKTTMTTVPGAGSKGYAGRKLTSAFYPGQYKHAYCQGLHKSGAAMRHVNNVNQYLILKNGHFHKNGNSKRFTKPYSLNFHGTRSKNCGGGVCESTNVNNWSLGCQVMSGKKFFNEILALIYSSTTKSPRSAHDMAACKRSDGGVKRTDCSRCMTYTMLNKED